MFIVCNIWMICLELNWFVYDPSWMLHLSEFVWTLRSSVLVVFNNFLLIDATARSKISSDQKCFFYCIKPYTPFHFSRTLPLSYYSKTFCVVTISIAFKYWFNIVFLFHVCSFRSFRSFVPCSFVSFIKQYLLSNLLS